jgi:hypothetical protein
MHSYHLYSSCSKFIHRRYCNFHIGHCSICVILNTPRSLKVSFKVQMTYVVIIVLDLCDYCLKFFQKCCEVRVFFKNKCKCNLQLARLKEGQTIEKVSYKFIFMVLVQKQFVVLL